MQGVAVFNGYIRGSVLFTPDPQTDQVLIEGHLKGFQHYVTGTTMSKHGMHIHVHGDIRQGCHSACEHFNPFNQDHGDLDDENSHAGDLGNIIVDSAGQSHFKIRTTKIALTGNIKNIIGRSLIIHFDEDDLGKGNHHDSLKTGHSGSRIACAIIGLIDMGRRYDNPHVAC